MATRNSPFGTFDHGAQYFTQRDSRFVDMLASMPGCIKAWNETVHVFDEHGRVSEPFTANNQPHWTCAPRMNALPQQLAQPLVDQGMVSLETRVIQIARQESKGWELELEGPNGINYRKSGFDGVLLAMPAPQTLQLLAGVGEIASLKPWLSRLSSVKLAPCWTLMLSFDRNKMGNSMPLWNAARSASHSIAWLARESSKPDRGHFERWILQASHAWSEKHFDTNKIQVHKHLMQAFFEITGIVCEPAHVDSQRWRWAQTVTPLGESHLWHSDIGIGVCGDWCLGHRLESAFISGLELAQAAA
jgi:renalase